DQKGADLRDVVLAGLVADTEEDCGEKRAPDRAKPADCHDDEDVDQVAQRKGVIESQSRYPEPTPDPPEPPPDPKSPAQNPGRAGTAAGAKSPGENAAQVAPEPPRHALVVNGGSPLRADPRVFESRDKNERDRKRYSDPEQPVDAELLAQERHRAAQVGRQFH